MLDIIERQQILLNQQLEEIEVLKEEIKRLKRHKGKLQIKPSQMDKTPNRKQQSGWQETRLREEQENSPP